MLYYFSSKTSKPWQTDLFQGPSCFYAINYTVKWVEKLLRSVWQNKIKDYGAQKIVVLLMDSCQWVKNSQSSTGSWDHVRWWMKRTFSKSYTYSNSNTQLVFSPSLTALSPETNFAIVEGGCTTHAHLLSEASFCAVTGSCMMKTGV